MFKILSEKAQELWDELPSFMREHKTMRTTIYDDSAEPAYGAGEPWVEKPIEEANLITSEVEDFFGKYHRPILDIDFEAALVPSSTPGHYHLYLDRLVPDKAYLAFLKAAAEAGIIQHGFYDGAVKRGATSARLPWIKKGDERANQLDPDKDVKAEIAELETRLAELKAKLEPSLDDLLAF